jgi:AAHS family 3-hydroxyphenylpropionic acid transporter
LNNRWTIPLCFSVAIAEGFDVQSAGVAAPKLAAAFHLGAGMLGEVFSASVLGLVLGAILGGLIADTIGRKRVLVFSMVTFGIFTLGTAAAYDSTSLLIMRFITGLGLGGAMSNVIALATENGRAEQRSLAVALVYCGMPLGGATASFVALLNIGDWRSIFYVGAAAPLLVAPVIAAALDESPHFEAIRRRPRGDARSGYVRAAAAVNSAMTALLGSGRAARTLILWATSFLTIMVLSLLLNWLPTLLVSRGLTRRDASIVQIVFNVGGALGSILVGSLLDRNIRMTTVCGSYAILAIALASMAVLQAHLASAAFIALFMGAGVIAAQAIIYAIAPDHYSTAHRSTGIGGVVAAGRLGSLVGPLVAGILLSAGDSAQVVLLQLLPVIACAGLSAIAMVVGVGRSARDLD